MYKLHILIFLLLILVILFGLGEMSKLRNRNKAIEEALLSLAKPVSEEQKQQVAENLKKVFRENKLFLELSSSRADDGVLCKKTEQWKELKVLLKCP